MDKKLDSKHNCQPGGEPNDRLGVVWFAELVGLKTVITSATVARKYRLGLNAVAVQGVGASLQMESFVPLPLLTNSITGEIPARFRPYQKREGRTIS